MALAIAKPSQTPSEVSLRFARTDQDINLVSEFRYSIYIEELGYNGLKIENGNRSVKDSLDKSGTIVIAERDSEIVGTGRINLIKEADFSEFESLHLDSIGFENNQKIALATKFMVIPELRGSTLFYEIVETLFESGAYQGADGFAIFCYDHLTPTFEKLGFRNYFEKVVVEEFGKVNPMLLLCDESYLKEVRSPLLRTLRRFKRKVETERTQDSRMQRYFFGARTALGADAI